MPDEAGEARARGPRRKALTAGQGTEQQGPSNRGDPRRGLARRSAQILDAEMEGVLQGGEQAGRLFENFVVLELCKQASWAEHAVRLYHFRSHTGREVDVVLENGRGEVVGIEIKFSATPSPRDFEGLKALREYLGKKFIRGVLIYTGREVVPFAEDLYALPASVLA